MQEPVACTYTRAFSLHRGRFIIMGVPTNPVPIFGPKVNAAQFERVNLLEDNSQRYTEARSKRASRYFNVMQSEAYFQDVLKPK